MFAPETAFATLIKAKETGALAVVRPTRVYLLDFFCSVIQYYLLLSPYLCFISILYLDLYVLGDDELISLGSLMQTKHHMSRPTSELRVRLARCETGLSHPVNYFY